MGYQPFLIAPYSTGLDTDLEPWLLPEEAFQEIINAHIHHGYVEKRSGIQLFATTASTDADFEITAASQTDPVTLTLVDVTNLSNGDQIQIDYVVGMTQLNGGKYLVSNKTGGAGGTIDLQDLTGIDIDGTAFGAYISDGYVSTAPGDRIMGIGRCYDSSGVPQMIVWDDKRGYYYNRTSNSLSPLDLDDIFDSGDTDYVWWEDWSSVASTAASVLNRLYFTNGKAVNGSNQNGIRFYSCASSPTAPIAVANSLFQPTINGASTIDGCKLIFSIRQRLLLLNTVEGGTIYPQRARWCQARNPGGTGTPLTFSDEWDDNIPGKGGFVDAPTSEHIISARFIQDNLVVWFTNSIWLLQPTSDPRLPFRWSKLNNFRGADAKFGTMEFDRYVAGVSIRGINITDGNDTRRIDQRIEDFVTDEVNSDEFDKVYLGRNHQLRRSWFLYPSLESDETDHALILDDESGAFSKYAINLNVLGYGARGVDLALDDFPSSPTDLNPFNLKVRLDEYGTESLQSFHWGGNNELFMGGDINGNVFELDTSLSDNGTPIEFELVSAAWNPFKKEALQTELGYIDIYMDSSRNLSLELEFYKDNFDFPYKKVKVNGLPNLKEIGELADIQPLSPSTSGYRFSIPQHGLTDNDKIYFYMIDGPEFLNDQEYSITKVTDNIFDVEEDFSANGTSISAITQANPAVVTAADHPFSDGDEVVISGGDMPEVIGNLYVAANVTNTTFELQGVNSTGFTAYTTGGVVFPYYTGGGIATEQRFYQDKIWKRAYGGGVGRLHHIRLLEDGTGSSLRIHAFMPFFKPIGKRII